MSQWTGELGMKVRRAALDREMKNLSLESRRVLLAAVYLFECSNTELLQVTGYDNDQLMRCIDELKALFLIGAPRIIAKEARFTIQSNTRTLALSYEKLLVTDPLSIRRKCERIRSGAKGIAKRENQREIGAALTQANAFLRENDWESAMQTIRVALRRHKENPDLLFALAKSYLAKNPADYATAKKVLKEAYDSGQRKYQLYAAWYDCESDSDHPAGAIEVASLALKNEIVERGEWLLKRAAAHKASSLIRERGKDIEGAIDDLRACNADLRVTWPLPSHNQAEEIYASLLSVGQQLWALGERHANDVPGWVRAFDILKEIIVPACDTAKVAENMVYCVEQIVNAATKKKSDLSNPEANLVNQRLAEATRFMSANRQGKQSNSFLSAESRVSTLSSRIKSLERLPHIETVTKPIVMGGEDFDLFLAHNSRDKVGVRFVSTKLKDRGISTWLDEKEIPPGQLFQDYIQKALPKAKAIAIFVGPSGIGKWQAFELRTAISRAVEKGIPVIPVFLPDAKDVSSELPFLMEFNCVRFQSLEDSDAIDRLVWGVSFRASSSTST